MIIEVIIILLILGAALAITRVIPETYVPAPIKQIINIVVVIAAIIYVLQLLVGHGPYFTRLP